VDVSLRCVYDTTSSVPAVIAEDAVVPANGVYHIREPGGELLAMIDPVAGIRYYHFDQLGSTRLLTDADGDVTDDYAYDAYGALLAHNRHADSVDQPYQYVGQLGYYTHHQEPGFGLLQLGVRFYDAAVGRFTQRDPLAIDEVADTVYADANPTALADPLGKKCHRVDAHHCGNYIGKCLQQLQKCLPCITKSKAIKRGMDRTKEWYVCDPWPGHDNGNTYCGVFRRRCRINIFRNPSTGCDTVLHELLHASWWYTNKNDEMRVTNAASMAWDYYCNKKAACYGGTPTKQDQAEMRSMLGCSSLP